MELFNLEAFNKTSGKHADVQVYDDNGKMTISIQSTTGSAVISLPEPQRSEFIRRINELKTND